MAEVVTVSDSETSVETDSHQEKAQPSEAKVSQNGKRKAVQLSDGEKIGQYKVKCEGNIGVPEYIVGKIRTLEKSTHRSYVLNASANLLLPGKPRIRSREEIKKMCKKQEESQEEGRDLESDKRQSQYNSEMSETLGGEKSHEKNLYCELCDVQGTSYVMWQTHINGKKHQKKVAAANGMQIAPSQHIVTPSHSPPMKTREILGAVPIIQEDVDAVESPVIGLSYISEIHLVDPTADLEYQCKLCECKCGPSSIIDHIVGIKHRINYIKENCFKIHNKVKSISKRSRLSTALEKYSQNIERRQGRGKMNVEEEFVGSPSPEPLQPPQKESSKKFSNSSSVEKRHLMSEAVEEKNRRMREALGIRRRNAGISIDSKQREALGIKRHSVESRSNSDRKNKEAKVEERKYESRKEKYRDVNSHHSSAPPKDSHCSSAPSILLLQNIFSYPSSVRRLMLKELAEIDPQELTYSVDASRLEAVVRRFRASLANFNNQQLSNVQPSQNSSNRTESSNTAVNNASFHGSLYDGQSGRGSLPYNLSGSAQAPATSYESRQEMTSQLSRGHFLNIYPQDICTLNAAGTARVNTLNVASVNSSLQHHEYNGNHYQNFENCYL